jgi:hypothetical protein
MQRILIIGLALILSACGLSSTPLFSIPSVPALLPSAPEPAYKELISKQLRKIFPEPATFEYVAVSRPLPGEYENAPVWRVCLMAYLKESSKDIDYRSETLFIQEGEVVSWRAASPEDACDHEQLETLSVPQK